MKKKPKFDGIELIPRDPRERRVVCEEKKYTPAERKALKAWKMAEAKAWVPPKTRTVMRSVYEGEPGYDKAILRETVIRTDLSALDPLTK